MIYKISNDTLVRVENNILIIYKKHPYINYLFDTIDDEYGCIKVYNPNLKKIKICRLKYNNNAVFIESNIRRTKSFQLKKTLEFGQRIDFYVYPIG